MLIDRISLILIGLALVLPVPSDGLRAQQADQAETGCTMVDVPEEMNETDRANQSLLAIRACGVHLIQRAQRLLRGDMTGFDGFDRDLELLIDEFDDEIGRIMGPGGVTETMQRVLKQKEREFETALAGGEQTAQSAESIGRQVEELGGNIALIKSEVSAIKEVIININASRPEIARRLRDVEFRELQEDLTQYINIISQTRKELEAIDHGATEGPETSN